MMILFTCTEEGLRPFAYGAAEVERLSFEVPALGGDTRRGADEVLNVQ